MRTRYRYVLLKPGEEGIDPNRVEEYVRELILLLFGVNGLSRILPAVVYKSRRGIVVLRVAREGLKMLRASLALDSRRALVVVKTTGSLRKAARIAESLNY